MRQLIRTIIKHFIHLQETSIGVMNYSKRFFKSVKKNSVCFFCDLIMVLLTSFK